jgi:uncharacterized protein YdhG (YjbR/CyaY superfamily)
MGTVSKKAAGKAAPKFSTEEQAAMKARARELKAEARANKGRQDGERELLAAIAAMPEPDRAMATKLHAIVTATAPGLMPKTWYGMPAYTLDDKVVCFFKAAHKFKTRYATLGFSDKAKLDDGAMWPTDFAVKALNAEVEKRVVALVKKAVG